MELSVSLNVGGKIFQTQRETLEAFPETLLGRLVQQQNKGNNAQVLQLSFDRNPKLVNSILNFYRTGELHVPNSLCAEVVERELRFWGIPPQLIAQCCWKKFDEDTRDCVMRGQIDRCLDDDLKEEDMKGTSLRSKIWLTMEHVNYSCASLVWNCIYFAVICYSVLTFVLQSTPAFRQLKPDVMAALKASNSSISFVVSQWTQHMHFISTDSFQWLTVSEEVCNVFFCVELATRFAVCPRKASFFGRFQNVFDLGLLLYALTVELVKRVWIPGLKGALSDGQVKLLLGFFALTVLRVFRILFLAKSFDVMKILWLSMKTSCKDILLLVICVLTFVTAFGSVVFVLEANQNTWTFTSVPAAMWWAVVTMTTVGYGDALPVSVSGQLVGAVCALSGVIVLALPVAVLASRFTHFHDNLSSQKQMRTVRSFWRNNPHFGSSSSSRVGLARQSKDKNAEEDGRGGGKSVEDFGFGSQSFCQNNPQLRGVKGDKLQELQEKTTEGVGQGNVKCAENVGIGTGSQKPPEFGGQKEDRFSRGGAMMVEEFKETNSEDEGRGIKKVEEFADGSQKRGNNEGGVYNKKDKTCSFFFRKFAAGKAQVQPGC